MKTQFARLNVYFSDLEVVVRKTIPSYELPQLFCDIGGTLGLWAGISIITILELFAYTGKLIGVLFLQSERRATRVNVKT